MQAIETCRTEALGGQVYVCPDCEQVQYSYHSCRNRHCPKCQNENAQAWLEQQQAMLLPVPYFLLTFTLPAGLREFARRQPRLIYDLLFRMSAEATQKLARDPRFVGGQVGMVGVLHTWGRNLAIIPTCITWFQPGAWQAMAKPGWPLARNFCCQSKRFPAFSAPKCARLCENRCRWAHSGGGLAAKLGGALQSGGLRTAGVEVPGALHLSGGHQQPAHPETGR
jgi:hypothetical protein